MQHGICFVLFFTEVIQLSPLKQKKIIFLNKETVRAKEGNPIKLRGEREGGRRKNMKEERKKQGKTREEKTAENERGRERNRG